MISLTLPLIHIYDSEDCDMTQLDDYDIVTEAEKAEFTKQDWNTYNNGEYTIKALPELAPAIYFSRRVMEPIIELAGRRYKVAITDDGMSEPFEAKGKYLLLTETLEEPTKSDASAPAKSNQRRSYWWKFFGQAVWVQNDFYPQTPDGRVCSHFCTINNGWGDCGNWNILIALNEDGVPDIAYFEASCG